MHLISDYYFWWRDYSFGLLIHHYDTLFHFMVIMSADYKYKQVDVLPSKNQALCDLIYNVVYIMDKSRE